jgi:hypothetical protein
MKQTALFILLLVATISAAAPKPDDYPVMIHVSSSQRLYIGSSLGAQLNVTIDGKRYVLEGPWANGLLALGDYKAKLIKEERKTTYESKLQYQLLFPDGKTRIFDVAGQSE